MERSAQKGGRFRIAKNRSEQGHEDLQVRDKENIWSDNNVLEIYTAKGRNIYKNLLDGRNKKTRRLTLDYFDKGMYGKLEQEDECGEAENMTHFIGSFYGGGEEGQSLFSSQINECRNIEERDVKN